MRVTLITGACLLLSTGLTLWSTWLWLLRLTAFCHLYLKRDNRFDKQTIEQAITETKSKQLYLAKVWFFASLYLLVVVVPFMFLFLLQSIGQMQLPAAIEIPQPWLLGLQLISACLGIIACTYSFVVFRFSAELELAPDQVANQAFKLCWKYPIELISLAFVLVLANLVLSCPQILYSVATHRQLSEINFWQEGIGQCWLGLTSFVLWTASLALVCELVNKLQPSQS